MSSVTIDDGEWFDDLEDSLVENSTGKSERVMSQMETLDRKRVSKDAPDRYPPGRERGRGLVESMMRCVITDSTLEQGARSHCVALTPSSPLSHHKRCQQVQERGRVAS